jgi:hypothetical protein
LIFRLFDYIDEQEAIPGQPSSNRSQDVAEGDVVCLERLVN